MQLPMLEQIRKIGWWVVEAALLVVIVCVLLNIILGRDSGAFISGVAGNALAFLREVPSGTFLGVVLLLMIYWVWQSRRP
jgi:hypothetical protein